MGANLSSSPSEQASGVLIRSWGSRVWLLFFWLKGVEEVVADAFETWDLVAMRIQVSSLLPANATLILSCSVEMTKSCPSLQCYS